MSYFLLELVFFASLGVVVYLFVRKLPAVGDVPEGDGSKVFLKIKQWGAFEKFDRKFSVVAAKMLRRAKLLLSQLDNVASRYLERVKKDKDRSKSIFHALEEKDEKRENKDKS